ncbi:MAG: hypothetical protein IPK80_28990 [Nannocystis sp.]|nr:hypothetical protein [Nannocystis sp.]
MKYAVEVAVQGDHRGRRRAHAPRRHRGIAKILCADNDYAYLAPPAKTALATLREAHQDTRVDAALLRPGGVVEVVEDGLLWWTFAGGRINATCSYALEAISPGWKIIPDNFMLKIRGEVDLARFRLARSS